MDRVLNGLKSSIKPDFVWWLLIAGGIVLRLRLYFAFPSLGGDEAAVARNIVDRTFSGLTLPLDYNQAAPILFLFIEKLSILSFGNKDFILRLFPFFSGLLAVYLLYLIVREHFGLAGMFAVFAFAISSWSLYYSSNVKQYSSDVMIALLLVYLSARCFGEKVQTKDFILLGIAGMMAIGLSHPSAFVIAGIGLVLVFEKLYRKNYTALAWSLTLGIAWAAVFGIIYFFSLRLLTAESYLNNYWRTAFMPLPPWSNPRWFVGTYLSLLSMSLGKTDVFFAVSWFLLILIGSVSYLARKRAVALIILLPFVLALAASALHKYPLQQRFLLFLVPFVYLLMAEGLYRFYLFASKWNRSIALMGSAVIFLIVLWPAIITAKRSVFNPSPPFDNLKPVVEYIVKNWRKGDALFVSGGGETFQYYVGSYGLDTGVLIIDNHHRIVRYGIYTQDLKMFAGKDRVWVVFAHFEEKSHTYIRYAKYLNRIGFVQDSFKASYARTYLVKFDP